MKNQKELFEFIATRFNTKKEMKVFLARELSVSVDTVSKWAYNRSVLKFDTLKKIVSLLGLNPSDIFTLGAKDVIINYKSLDLNDIDSYKEHLSRVALFLASAAGCSESIAVFLADEVPIFHLMAYPKLVYFKLYAYGYEMNSIEESYEEFICRVQSYNLEPLFDEIVGRYNQISSTEIWDENAIDSIISQMQNLDALEKFNEPESKLELLDELSYLLQELKMLAKSGRKSSGKSFNFFLKTTAVATGYVIIKTSHMQSLSMKLDTINSVTTYDKNMVEDLYRSFQASLENSRIRGYVPEAERQQYFKLLMRKIEHARQILDKSPQLMYM